jgi:CBS domain containing-hemolysin-like protein
VKGASDLERLHLGPTGPSKALSILKVFALSSALVSGAALAFYGADGRWFVVALVSIFTLALLGGIHIGASAISWSRRERIALGFARPVGWLAWALSPLVAGVERLGRAYPNGNGTDAVPAALQDEEPDGEQVIDPIDEREARMIRGVVRQDKTVAREIMVPRVDIVAAELGASASDLAALMTEGGHSRVPVYREDLDHVVGIAYSRDLLRRYLASEDGAPLSVESVIRPPMFIPEAKTLEELLSEFKDRRVQMAIVVDEYGGVSGLVTIEDLLEEIVGEIEDEFDMGESGIQRIANDDFVMDARVSVAELDDLFNVAVEGEGFDTLGGLVYQRLGKIPSQGDVVEYDGLRIEVLSTAGRRLKNLHVTRRSPRG